jgi:drug/metabolite transporter (DMT)-like permease
MRRTGATAALGAALLFGVSTPLAKLLLASVNPWLLAGLLYFGAGIGLTLYRYLIHAPSVKLAYSDTFWLAGAIIAGGLIAPVLLMIGLTRMPASSASLLLNAEAVFTALLAWITFKENFDWRIVLGMIAIVAGTVVLSWPEHAGFYNLWPALVVVSACLAWGVDNNLTRKVALKDASWIASIKGLVAGSVNLALAFSLGGSLPPFHNIIEAMLLGFFAYGISLALFVVALRSLGTGRTAAYFSVAPFFGAILAVAFGDPVTLPLLVAGTLMLTGIWLHLSEHHKHEHQHTEIVHEHEHTHDEHHQHTHDQETSLETKHSHIHKHEALKHTHPHYPDAHHQHRH